ncbi:MAG: fluoride efflux transporter FluC [Caldimicrobium sp.]
MLFSLVLVGIGGALGSMLRFLISTLMIKYVCSFFPCGTLVVNLVGSFCITFLMELFIFSSIDPIYRYLLIIGFLGGFTTLSSVIYDTLTLFRKGELALALFNLLLNYFLSLLFGFFGLLIAKKIIIKGF